MTTSIWNSSHIVHLIIQCCGCLISVAGKLWNSHAFALFFFLWCKGIPRTVLITDCSSFLNLIWGNSTSMSWLLLFTRLVHYLSLLRIICSFIYIYQFIYLYIYLVIDPLIFLFTHSHSAYIFIFFVYFQASLFLPDTTSNIYLFTYLFFN